MSAGNENFVVPTGEWVDVPKGMLIAPGTYVDKDGVLRMVSDDSMAVWHWRGKGEIRCARGGFTPATVVWVENAEGRKAPWCPDCLKRRIKADEADAADKADAESQP